MRLDKIKFAGFKSFADPTTFVLQSNLTGIVGPNGCGKSNIIDAVKWVMGESSAKQLRGQNMADVIFNGTTGRPPLAQASIELYFDNTDKTIIGEYAAFDEICLKRELSRDGDSRYYLNNTRCRRRDILDIFQGTGLGSNNYAIISQGTISQIIEAKPEDMRGIVEEAAKISKYKERRRETETRMQHTQDNLNRLTDLREELEKQLAHLKRQANAAERYQALKQEEHLIKGQWQALHWQQLNQRIEEKEYAIREQETALDSEIAKQRGIDTDIEKLREHYTTCTDEVNAVQGQYYQQGAEIAKSEQQISGLRERTQQLSADLAAIEKTWVELLAQLDDDSLQTDELIHTIAELEPESAQAKITFEQAQQALQATDKAQQQWQQHWDAFNERAAKTSRQTEVGKTKIQHLQQQLTQINTRVMRWNEEFEQLDIARYEEILAQMREQLQQAEAAYAHSQTEQQQLQQDIHTHRTTITNQRKVVDQTTQALQTIIARQASLQALQEAALGKDKHIVSELLVTQQWQNNPRLAELLQVEPGWELAVETVLGPYLQAVCVEEFNSALPTLQTLSAGELFAITPSHANSPSTAITAATLLSKVANNEHAVSLLAGIYCVPTLEAALILQAQLQAHESVITQTGLWLGANWVRIIKDERAQAGVIEREKTLQQLIIERQQLQNALQTQTDVLQQLQRELALTETARDQAQERSAQLAAERGLAQSQCNTHKAKVEQAQNRRAVLQKDINEATREQEQITHELSSIEVQQQEAVLLLTAAEQERAQLLTQRDSLRLQLQEARETARSTRERLDELHIQLQSNRNQLHYLQQNIARGEKQRRELHERREALQQATENTQAPLPELQTQLEEQLARQLTINTTLQAARAQLSDCEQRLRAQEMARSHAHEQTEVIRKQLEALRLQWQAEQVRRQTHQENIVASGFMIDVLLAEMPAEATIEGWTAHIERLATKIQRLGPINLAAIDEYQQLSERKNYLDQQNADLVEALATLQTAIAKIDRETRTRFKETFEEINRSFGEYFPKIFGGGKAYLELTDTDILTSGIVVRAQPPGKRNTTIHMLSGGEKALTAIALVFSLFKLNPAPFCMLDEVDAPLDDANVGRFCHIVTEMAEKVQFIFVTHNKVTMEMANQLCGITMHEPGVSRIVSVDIAAAVEMAEA